MHSRRPVFTLRGPNLSLEFVFFVSSDKPSTFFTSWFEILTRNFEGKVRTHHFILIEKPGRERGLFGLGGCRQTNKVPDKLTQRRKEQFLFVVVVFLAFVTEERHKNKKKKDKNTFEDSK